MDRVHHRQAPRKAKAGRTVLHPPGQRGGLAPEDAGASFPPQMLSLRVSVAPRDPLPRARVFPPLSGAPGPGGDACGLSHRSRWALNGHNALSSPRIHASRERSVPGTRRVSKTGNNTGSTAGASLRNIWVKRHQRALYT